MSRLALTSVENKVHLHHRIMASLTVQASWVDAESGNTVFVEGLTENLGENSALVNLNILPPVGSEVRLRIYDEEKTIIEVPTQVIRVERDPSKPLAALSVLENLKKWKQNALTAAQKWVTRNWQLNYDEEWVN
ncbi:hypothetical protein BH24ACI2_BH24ACI2_10190 [soil metagenome]|nr:hypothetical protein [Acidobacteriota bacterium]